MSVTSSRQLQVLFSGDITESIVQSALDNIASPAMTVIQTLAIGDNTITAPVVSGITVTGLTIIPPAANVNLIKLKQTGADVGVALHKTDFTSLALDTTFTTLVLNAAAQIIGVRLIWS